MTCAALAGTSPATTVRIQQWGGLRNAIDISLLWWGSNERMASSRCISAFFEYLIVDGTGFNGCRWKSKKKNRPEHGNKVKKHATEWQPISLSSLIPVVIVILSLSFAASSAFGQRYDDDDDNLNDNIIAVHCPQSPRYSMYCIISV